ncbi:hypothetical protein V6N12_026398 [Hibiscus sabdariffa]|uniref:Uncharacterized protein n=1 Tax=Hibiscus sabdariffa TaxID=183260 RepID=A0ABR2DSS9_9ROSI
MRYGAQCQGITLSPVQADRANALAAAQGLADKVYLSIYLTGFPKHCITREGSKHLPKATPLTDFPEKPCRAKPYFFLDEAIFG